MTTNQNALLLVGSAKADGASTSGALGSYLLARLAANGMQTETLLLYRNLRTPERTAALLAAVDAADLVILAFPLYVDTLPYLVTAALEQIAEHRAAQAAPSPTGFAAIVNCGFPEAHHNDVALAVCGQFARQTGMEWMGGLSLGGGGTVNGQPLAQGGGKVRNLVASLDLAANALSAGQPVPPQAVELMAKPIISHALYVAVGNLSWHITAWQNGVHGKLGARPFA
jgi:hypothetical protein